jgi:hypothetical protein
MFIVGQGILIKLSPITSLTLWENQQHILFNDISIPNSSNVQTAYNKKMTKHAELSNEVK